MSRDTPLTEGVDREHALSEAFVRLSDTLVSDFDVQDLLTDLADTCVRLLNVDAVGILLLEEGQLELAAASSTSVHDVEIFQLQSREGPCLDAVRTARPVVVADLQTETGWPQFTQVALRRGFRAVYAVPMRLREQTLGGMNLFKRAATEWPAADVRVAKALADTATIGILQHRSMSDARTVQGQLQTALESRILIEQAKGMVAEQLAVTTDDAFTVLRRYSRNNNVALRTVAQETVDGRLKHTRSGTAGR